MNKKWVYLFILVILIFGSAIIYQKNNTTLKKTEKTQESKKQNFYYTCPMHPQIHQDHPGECPICHMKLVKVKEQNNENAKKQQKSDKRTSVQANLNQLELIGLQKVEAEKMDLKIKIPVSGRIISQQTVAFQVYETDLRVMKPGLRFSGEESMHPEIKLEGTISSVDSIVDPTSRTIRVLGSLKNAPEKMISESSFRGEVEIELKDRLAIPESSVLHTGKDTLVYLVGDDNFLKPKAIAIGQKSEGFYEVLSGLNEGDLISSGPNFLIDSEAKIRGAND